MQKFKKLFKQKTLAHRLIACALVLSMALPSFPASATSEPSFDNGYSTSDEDIKDESADGEVTRDTQNSQSIEDSQNTQDSQSTQDSQNTQDSQSNRLIKTSKDKQTTNIDQKTKDSENLSVVVKEPVYAPSDNINYDLKNFIKRATLAGENITVDGNNWKVINSGVNYNMSLGFDESDNYQFSENDTVMTYTLPNGVKALGGGAIPITVKAGGKTYVVENNQFTVSGDGKTISLKLNTNDPDLAELNKASNATFTLNFEASFELSDGKHEMDFGNGVKKNLEVKNSHNAGVTKTCEYDSATGELIYTINVKATGSCENITVTDTMSGTAYAVKQDSIKCTPDGTGFTVSNKSDSGFTATIGSLSNQTATITYRAYLKDSSKVSGDGTITAGKNTVTVNTADDSNSNDNTATTPDTTFPVTSVLEKTGSVVEENGTPKVDSDGNVTINWTIKVNNERIIPLNGTPIKDIISTNQIYSGTGITVKKTDKNGTTSSSNIAWANLEKTNDSFTYTPSDSTPYLYEISYATKAEVSNSYTDFDVTNKVNFKGKDTEEKVGVGVPEGGKFEIQKDIVNVDKDKGEISWVITMKIPPAGLPNLVLRDAYPHCKDPNDDKKTLYYDSLVPGSVNVSGLDSDESYKIYEDEDSYKRLKIQFYQDTLQKTGGLKGTGSARTITVNLSTKTNPDWLEYAKNNPTEGRQEQRHSNLAEASINGKTISDYARVYLVDPTFKKSLEGGLKWANASDGSTLPYLDYKLVFTYVNEDEFTINETLPEGFVFYKEAVGSENADVYTSEVLGGDSPNSMTHKSNSSVTFEDNNKIKVKVPKKPDGDYYTYYEVTYHIIAKDSAAAKALNQRAVDNNGSIDLVNTAEYKGVTDSASIKYTPDIGYYLWKSLNNEAELSDYQNEAKYSININHLGLKLNNGNNVTLTDTFENLDIDYSSIKFTPADACVSYDVAGSTLTAVIKDATPVILTYSARVKGSGDVTFKNVAEIAGHAQNVENTKNFKAYDAGSGSASILDIRIMKYEAGNMSKRLANVSFKLFEATSVDPTTKIATAGNPVMDKTGKQVTVTTDADGFAMITGNKSDNGWELKAGHTYYLEEVAPLDGYKEDHTKYTFTISADGTTDYDNYIYRDDDTVKIKNEKKVDYPLTINKTMTGDIPADIDLHDITIKVLDTNGNIFTQTTLGDIADNAKVGKSGYSYDQTKNQYKWVVSGLADNQAVVVMETVDKIKDGFSLSKSYSIDNGSTAAYPESTGISTKAGQTVNLTNEYSTTVGNLQVTKTVTGAPASESDKKYSFTVTKEGKWYNKNGTASDTEIKHTISANETISFEGLPEGVYEVSEVASSTTIANYTLDTDSVTSGFVEINAGSTKSLTLENKYTQNKGNLSIKKTVSTVNTNGTVDKSTLPTTYQFAVKNSDGNYIKDTNGTVGDKTVNYFTGIAENATLTINNLPVGKYTIEEKDARVDGLTLTVTGLGDVTITKDATASITVNNEYETPKKPVGELHIKKKMAEGSDNVPDGKTFPISLAFDKDGNYAVNVNKSGSKMVSFKSGVAQTFDIKSDGTIDVEDIPLDITYTVSETLPTADTENGYSTVSVSNSSKKISTDGQNEEVIVTNKYAKPADTGSLAIKKTVTTDDTNGEVDKKSLPSTYQFAVKNSDGNYIKDTNGTIGDNTAFYFTGIAEDATLTINNLPVGKYTIEEKDANVDGFALTTTGLGEVSVTKNSDATATVNNQYTANKKPTGDDNDTNPPTGDDDSSKNPSGDDDSSRQPATEQIITSQPSTEQTTTAEVTTVEPTTSVEISTEKKKVSSKKKSRDEDDDDEDDGKGKLIITIHDEKTGKAVPGAKVTVTTPDGKTKKYTTDSNGQIKLNKTEAGDYTVKVTKVPKGYTVTKNKEVDVEVEKNKTTTALVKINKDGDVTVSSKTTKTAAKTGDTIPVKPITTALITAVLGLIILSFKKKQYNR